MDSRRIDEDPGTVWFRIVTDRREIDQRMLRARQMRAEVVAGMLVAAVHGTARLGRAALAALARWRRQRAVRRELAAYPDRELDELGVRRSDVPAIAKGRPVPRASG
jgi:uncharacterized protein YjiS (DUF1127 family)